MELNLNDCNQSINPTVSFLPNDSLCALSEEQYLGKEGSAQTHTHRMASSVSMARLVEERRQWRKDHPFGFWAKPVQKTDGSLNMYEWECGIPGKAQVFLFILLIHLLPLLLFRQIGKVEFLN